jgi:signal transduction histidine kinase
MEENDKSEINTDNKTDYTIVVVDDDKTLCLLIQRNLQRLGFKSQYALNGSEFINKLTKIINPILLLDYQLPDMTGDQIIEYLNRHQFNIPFIIITGHGDEKIAVEMMKLGSRDYLVKDEEFLELLPVVLNQLIDQLETEKRLIKAEAELKESIIEKRILRIDKLDSISRLSVILVHKLSNPLDGTLRYINLLMDQTPEDDPKRIYVESVRDGLIQMANIIRGLSNFARKSRPVLMPTDIKKSIKNVLAYFEEQISAQQIKVVMEFEENMPVGLGADISQIFENIIKNSIQAMPNGGTLSIRARVSKTQMFEVSISDTGHGIHEEILDNIFEPFFTTKEIGKGIGLGLFISQGIAESYNGSITVKSKPCEGTTFTIILPISEIGLKNAQ